MLTGNPSYRSATQAANYRQLTFTCHQNAMTRTGETKNFPATPCPAGIKVNTRLQTCWDGQILDSADHQSHKSYPASVTFECGGAKPTTQPEKNPQNNNE